MTLSVMLSKYALAGLELIRSLPVASIVDPASPGSSFAIHPGTGLVRIYGRFVQLPLPPTKTPYEPPTTALEHPNPSSRAIPTPTTITTLDPAGLTSQSGTGVLVAISILFVVWLFSLLALALAYKPVFTWLTNLRRRVLKTTCLVTQSIVRVVHSASSKLNALVDIIYRPIRGIQVTLGFAQAKFYRHLKSGFLKSSRVLLPIGAFAAIVDVIRTVSDLCDITIPYASILLVIAASPAAVASCIFLAVLAGIIKPVPSTLTPVMEHEADFLAGMRVQRKRFISEIIPRDHAGEAVLDIRRTYHQILHMREQTRAARSCTQHVKSLVGWLMITVLALPLIYLPVSSVPARIHELSSFTLSPRTAEESRLEIFYPTANVANNAINSTNNSLTLIWTRGVSILPVTTVESPFINNLDFSQFNSYYKPFPRIALSLVEHSTRNNTA